MGAGAISHAGAYRRGSVTGVVAALPAEARWLRGGASALVVRIGGIGAEPARRAAASLIADGARSLVSWGTAAGLAPGLSLGTLIIADRVVAGADTLAPDPDWSARVADALRGIVSVGRGTLACPATVVRTAAAKRALAETTGAIAADMESAAIGRVAREAGVPWIVLRVVSDTADMVVPASVVSAIGSDGKLKATRLLGELARRPGDMAAFPALARGMRVAGETMRRVASVLETA
jgi:adenosylhomocysteine nucleosidase